MNGHAAESSAKAGSFVPRWECFVLVWTLLGALAFPRAQDCTAADLIDLRPAAEAGSFRQAKVVLDVEGKLKLNADGQEVTHLPLKAHAQLQYAERVLATSKQWTEVRLVRAYQSGRADLQLRDSKLTNELRDSRRLIVVESGGNQAVHFCPEGPLSRDELELVETPASGIALEALLPQRATKIESQWPLADSTVARLLGLEVVSQQNVVCTLTSAKDHVAVISLEGTVAGAVGGVSSDIELKGKLNFDLRQRHVTWLALAIKENRAIGHAQPGFEVVATLRLASAPCPPVPELSDKALAGLPLSADPGRALLELRCPEGGFQLLYDRRWQIMAQQQDVTILRLIDRGDLIAQCNLSPRPALGQNERLTLEGFQEDVRRTLGNNFGQLIEASEETNDAGIQVLRVVAAGSVGELPIQWTYYHLSNDEGRRAAFVFTIESSLVERFAQIDHELIAGFRFLPDQAPTLAR